MSKIMGQLWKIRDTHDSAAVLLEKINWMGSTSIRLEDGVRHDPDGQFRHQDARYPGEVIEVANTQQKKHLPRLADDYIQSSGNIKMVIGIKVEKSKMADSLCLVSKIYRRSGWGVFSVRRDG